ncbi:hypothetical protein EWM64_g9500 [Hericium alpestre]|uniref:Uncharacterized protein n=1 Tax=Hericium alpestre TaxID=135208 RepID=A0A4Y9ZIL1_9AGAM|nr:hypothetical protein EWM64_g9500 [Hericium alpestre]
MIPKPEDEDARKAGADAGAACPGRKVWKVAFQSEPAFLIATNPGDPAYLDTYHWRWGGDARWL